MPGISPLLLLAGFTLRPYIPPSLTPEPEPLPSAVERVEIQPSNESDWDANVLARPIFSAPLAGQVARGARIRVRGEVKVQGGRACPTQLYYALEPFGWICSAEAKPTTLAETTESVLQLVPGTPVPYRYAMVVVEEGSFLPMWGSLADLAAHAEPERQLARGDTLALGPKIERFEGESYYVTVDGKVVPIKGTTGVQRLSEWQGVEIDAGTHLPFAWVTPNLGPVYDAPGGKKIDQLARRTRVDILDEQLVGRLRWLRIGEGRYMKADQLNEVRKLARPSETGQQRQWFDVDLGEQVVVAYVGDEPAYATLTSSGREPNHTPRGNYPIWGKASAITMKSQDYDDVPYYVNRVPWVMFFQAHNALHGAYWHDRFGVVKSHGCANLAPKDAQYLFDWLEPKLPPGWTGVRYWDLREAPVAHVRDSRKKKPIFQERNIGPPDKADEAERLEQALVRREAIEREAEAAAEPTAPGVPPGVAQTPGSEGAAPTPAPAASLAPAAVAQPAQAALSAAPAAVPQPAQAASSVPVAAPTQPAENAPAAAGSQPPR